MKTMRNKVQAYEAPKTDVIVCLTDQIVCNSASGTLDPWQIEFLD